MSKVLGGRAPRSEVLAAVMVLFCWPEIGECAPPPPIPPGYIDLAKGIASCLNDQAEDRCLGYLSSEVKITEDGKMLGQGQTVARVLIRKWISRGWSFRPIVSAEGGREILVLEQVTNIPRVANDMVVHDCCYWTRSIKYTLSDDGKVSEIDIENAETAANIIWYR